MTRKTQRLMQDLDFDTRSSSTRPGARRAVRAATRAANPSHSGRSAQAGSSNDDRDNWIQGAVSRHPGALHKQLHVPEGKKIPRGRLEAAAKKGDSKAAKRARLALLLVKLNAGRAASHPAKRTVHKPTRAARSRRTNKQPAAAGSRVEDR